MCGADGRWCIQAALCGRQSCLRAAFQAAVSDTRRISQASLHDAARNEVGEMPANCVSGLFDGGLKGRLQARLPWHDCLPHKAVAWMPRKAKLQR